MTKPSPFTIFAYAVTGLGSLAILGTLMSYIAKNPREKIVDAAMREVGDQDPDKYWAMVQPTMKGTGAAWCGGFALWALKQAGLVPEMDWTQGKGFIFKGNRGAPLPVTKNPQPGDIAYFDNLQHHAIVRSFDPLTGALETVDGNQSPGERVALRTRNIKEAAAIFSIAPLLAEESV
jgi:hypothetical protein